MFPQRHHSIIGGNGLDQMFHGLPSSPMPTPSRWKPSIEVAPNCPRCASTNTKFCYYNNYSLSQPRYFCKGCRRYWTKGGSLRNVPVGGGCRKNRRGKSSKQHQSERLSMNSSVSEDRESSISDPHQTNASRDIDMALVFAKFLNQKPSTGEEFENGSSSSNNYLTPESVETENDAVIQPENKGCDGDAMLTIENFGGEELSLSGIDELEGFLGEDVAQDVLWSNDASTMSSSSVTWQPPMNMMMQMQLQEFEYSMPFNEDAQLLPITVNSSLSDNWSTWSSFDLSTMQVFSSRP